MNNKNKERKIEDAQILDQPNDVHEEIQRNFLENYELGEVQELEAKEKECRSIFGNIHVERLKLSKIENDTEKQFEEIQIQKQKYFEKLQNKYGGQLEISLETGEYRLLNS